MPRFYRASRLNSAPTALAAAVSSRDNGLAAHGRLSVAGIVYLGGAGTVQVSPFGNE
jgi:hypothetical protein